MSHSFVKRNALSFISPPKIREFFFSCFLASVFYAMDIIYWHTVVAINSCYLSNATLHL